MSKKQASKQDQPIKSDNPVFEDFFTHFIEKRKKYFHTKLEEIAVLEKSKDLKPDQKEKVNNKQNALDKLKYYDEIKELYFEAAAKGKHKPVSVHHEEHKHEFSVNDLIDLIAVGNNLRNNKCDTKALDSSLVTSIGEIHDLLNQGDLVHHLTQTKHKLAEISKNNKLHETIKALFKTVEVLEKPKQAPIKKSLLQHDSSDEEPKQQEEPIKKIAPKKQNPQEAKTSLGLMLAPLPEKEEAEEEVFVTYEKPKFFKYKKRYHKDDKEPNEKKENEDNQENQENQEVKELSPEEEEARKKSGYKGKRFDPNYKKDGYQKPKEGQQEKIELKRGV